MTFDAYERSADLGEPVLLFDFFVGLAHWRYTTADREIAFGAVSYIPAAISAGAINQGQEIKRKTLTVDIDMTALVVQRLQQYPPSTDFMLRITAIHQSDPDLQGYVVFIGRVMSQSQVGAKVTLNCEPAYTGVKATGLRRRWQLNCAHVLYGIGCTLSPLAFKVESTITAAVGPVITCGGLVPPTGLGWNGGYVEWDSGQGYNERRSINGAAGDVLTLNYGSPDLVTGLAVICFPGCDHSTVNCTAFGNIKNYGGQPYIPSVNPLAGNPIY
jgi:Phage conserved hypothetical protein BR0599